MWSILDVLNNSATVVLQTKYRAEHATLSADLILSAY